MEKKVICSVCGEEINEFDSHYVDGKEYCHDCFEERYFVCADCGETFSIDERIITDNDDEICQSCFEENYFTCDDCGAVVHNDDCYNILNRYGDVAKNVCENCADDYSVCDDCGEHYLDDCLESVDDGDSYVCNNCLDSDRYGTCENCGQWYTYDNLYWNERHECYYCEECDPCDELIAEYHDHSNSLEFFGDDNGETVPYLGVELEIDKGRNNNDECAEYTKGCFPDNFIYFEYDGSLNDGFENITQPATLEYHYGLKNNYNEMFKNAVSMGFRSHDTRTCGLHIHFNRNFFRENEELYVTRLLYLVEKFWDELVKFSRRDIESLNRWAKKYDKTPEDVVNEWKTKNWYLDRYQAVNLTNNNTIEFRMFRGTLKLNTFIATLQLCHTLVMTAKNIESTEAIQSLKWEDMLQYDEIKAYWEEVKDR